MTDKKPERLVQEALVEIAKHCWWGKYLFMIPNSLTLLNKADNEHAYRNYLAAMGLKKGVSDQFLAIPNNKYAGLFLEAKAENGKLSEAQAGFIEAMKDAHYDAYVYDCPEKAHKYILEYLANMSPIHRRSLEKITHDTKNKYFYIKDLEDDLINKKKDKAA